MTHDYRLIFRFRDLVTKPGDPIELHRTIAEKADNPAGHCWWGWWNKSGEVVPMNEFADVIRRAREGDERVLLFDSGHLTLHSARLHDIALDAGRALISSPDRDLTPDYYDEQRYPCWLALSDFSLVDSAATTFRLSYRSVPEFFENGHSNYAAFDDKVVFSLPELRQQDRSVWFVRPTRSTDRTHEINLVSHKAISPQAFDTQPIASKSDNLLWISDLHFGDHHEFPTASTTSLHDLGQAIEDAAKQHGHHDFASAIITGDLTWAAARDEFRAASDFVGRICRSPSSFEPYRTVVCPGNHDLRFSAAPADPAAPTFVPADASALHDDPVAPDAKAEYSKWYERLFYTGPNRFLSMGRRFFLGGTFPVDVVALNSSLIQQKKNWFQGLGFVGEDQLRNAADEFGWNDGSSRVRPFRIVVLHHHLLPVTYSDEPRGGVTYSLVLDAERVNRWLCRHRVDLVLHGHMHNDFCARLSRPVDTTAPDGQWHTVTILGLGSSGVKAAHRNNRPNMFGVVSVQDRSAVSVSVYSVFPGTEQSTRIWHVTVRKGEEA